MNFNKLNYSEKIAIAKLFFRENFYDGCDNNFVAQQICINWGKVQFYGKSFYLREIKLVELKKFFDDNNQIIRKEKLLQIRKNLV